MKNAKKYDYIKAQSFVNLYYGKMGLHRGNIFSLNLFPTHFGRLAARTGQEAKGTKLFAGSLHGMNKREVHRSKYLKSIRLESDRTSVPSVEGDTAKLWGEKAFLECSLKKGNHGDIEWKLYKTAQSYPGHLYT